MVLKKEGWSGMVMQWDRPPPKTGTDREARAAAAHHVFVRRLRRPAAPRRNPLAPRPPLPRAPLWQLDSGVPRPSPVHTVSRLREAVLFDWGILPALSYSDHPTAVCSPVSYNAVPQQHISLFLAFSKWQQRDFFKKKYGRMDMDMENVTESRQ